MINISKVLEFYNSNDRKFTPTLKDKSVIMTDISFYLQIFNVHGRAPFKYIFSELLEVLILLNSETHAGDMGSVHRLVEVLDRSNIDLCVTPINNSTIFHKLDSLERTEKDLLTVIVENSEYTTAEILQIFTAKTSKYLHYEAITEIKLSKGVINMEAFQNMLIKYRNTKIADMVGTAINKTTVKNKYKIIKCIKAYMEGNYNPFYYTNKQTLGRYITDILTRKHNIIIVERAVRLVDDYITKHSITDVDCDKLIELSTKTFVTVTKITIAEMQQLQSLYNSNSANLAKTMQEYTSLTGTFIDRGMYIPLQKAYKMKLDNSCTGIVENTATNINIKPNKLLKPEPIFTNALLNSNTPMRSLETKITKNSDCKIHINIMCDSQLILVKVDSSTSLQNILAFSKLVDNSSSNVESITMYWNNKSFNIPRNEYILNNLHEYLQTNTLENFIVKEITSNHIKEQIKLVNINDKDSLTKLIEALQARVDAL